MAYLSLSTANLPDPVIDPAAGSSPEDHFDIVLYTGNATERSLSLDFSPDLLWFKRRSGADNHIVNDSVRGAGKDLKTNESGSEGTATTSLLSFDSDGFTIGTGGDLNGSGATFVTWCWRGSDSSAVSNTDGSITSTVSANTTSGMSIVGFTGTGANATVGHGLDQKPEMFWVKNRDRSAQWSVYHKEIGATKFVELSTSAGAASDTPTFNNTEPTATVFSVGTGNGTNASGEDLIACCFHSVDGFSKVGSYTGNGSSDGPFIYTGFKPKFIISKRTDSSGDWHMYDAERDTYNVVYKAIWANYSSAEYLAYNNVWDFLSNGFKARTSSVITNASGGTYIYMAFAETPFRYATAR
jgi:hypothetical protein